MRVVTMEGTRHEVSHIGSHKDRHKGSRKGSHLNGHNVVDKEGTREVITPELSKGKTQGKPWQGGVCRPHTWMLISQKGGRKGSHGREPCADPILGCSSAFMFSFMPVDGPRCISPHC
eukprot:281678-Pelagomonas_calceolata.AAC.3